MWSILPDRLGVAQTAVTIKECRPTGNFKVVDDAGDHGAGERRPTQVRPAREMIVARNVKTIAAKPSNRIELY